MRKSHSTSRLVRLVLKDGRSVVGGCGSQSRASIARALAEPGGVLALTSDDRVDVLPASDVSEFALFHARAKVPHATVIYRLVHV